MVTISDSPLIASLSIKAELSDTRVYEIFALFPSNDLPCHSPARDFIFSKSGIVLVIGAIADPAKLVPAINADAASVIVHHPKKNFIRLIPVETLLVAVLFSMADFSFHRKSKPLNHIIIPPIQ